MKPLVLALSLFSLFAFADIKEIPPEEMTEAYIRDTTVIVPKAQPNQSSDSTDVRVSPNAVPSSAETLNKKGTEKASPKPLQGNAYLPEQRELQLQQNELRAQSQQPIFDPQQKSRDDNLRDVLRRYNIDFATVGVPEYGPIDYSKLQFPNRTMTDNNNNISSTPNQVIITIPNSSGYKPSTQTTPGGEYQIKVDNNQLQLIINRPPR